MLLELLFIQTYNSPPGPFTYHTHSPLATPDGLCFDVEPLTREP
jgi:hypothetical protein